MNKLIKAKKVNSDFGLRFRKKQIVYMEKPVNIKVGVDMLFVFFSIDCFFLNEKFEVIEIKKGLKPFINFYNPKKDFRYLLECPTGWLVDINLKDKIEFINHL